MSQLRRNPFTGEWTLCAENRKDRPYEFVNKMQPKKNSSEHCPFCGGHERWTTEAVYQDGKNEEWQIRVFPNMFPAVTAEVEKEPVDEEGFYEQKAARGRHEVLVDTPLHEATIDTFSYEQMKQVLLVLQKRHEKIKSDKDCAYVQVFKNCGPSAGMSIQHSHWQLMGLPMVPERVRVMAKEMAGDCLLCKTLAHEVAEKSRVAMESNNFIAIAPYASRFSYELWLCPKRHVTEYGELEEKELEDLAEMLHSLLPKIVALREDIGYNICFMDAPKGAAFHWHLELLPRIGGFAGFEYATNSFINSVLPEKAAAYFRGEEE